MVGKYRRTLQSDRRHLLEQFNLVEVARNVVGPAAFADLRAPYLAVQARIELARVHLALAEEPAARRGG